MLGVDGLTVSKEAVREFWDAAGCGERLLLPSLDRTGFARQATERYRLEPFIERFAKFPYWRDRRVLEIGVGLGADHQRFVEAGAQACGIDLTPRAVKLCRQRLAAFGLDSDVEVGDAEQLPYEADTFDLVWSWGVLHHSPDPSAAVREIHRVLKPGATAKVMIYHKWSIVGCMLWLRYALLRGRPWTSMRSIYARYLESPGTRAYTIPEAQALFSRFAQIRIETVLTHGDLLASEAGQRHRGYLLSLARLLWPRRLIARLLPGAGLFMLVEATKSEATNTR